MTETITVDVNITKFKSYYLVLIHNAKKMYPLKLKYAHWTTMKKSLKAINIDIGEMHSHTWDEGLNGIKSTWFKRTIPIDKLKGYLITKDTTSVTQETSSGITVKQLFELCKQEINRGNGNKVILISEDDELNGFHTLWEGFTSDPHTIMMYSADDMFHNDNDPSTVILLS